MDVIKTQQISTRAIEKVVVHPLVLLSLLTTTTESPKTLANASSAFCSVPLSKALSTLLIATPFHLKKMIRILPSGFLITITMNQCFQCLRESMRRSILLGGIALDQNCEKMTLTFMVYSMTTFRILFWL